MYEESQKGFPRSRKEWSRCVWQFVTLFAVVLLFSACGGGGDNAPSGQGNCATNKTCPIANAGPDQEVLVGKQVTLDGSHSSSPLAQPITYQWTLTEKPATSTATLAGPTSVRPTFTADVPGTYTAKLVVTSGAGSSPPDTVNVTAGTGNLPPVANAGSDETVPVGKLVTLDGTKSYDPNDTPVTYSWRLQTQPPKSQALLLNPNSATPSFTPDVPGDYKLSLTVSDGTLTSPPNQVTITAITGNSPPIADAGPDQTVPTGQPVTLTGAGSRDPDGDPLTYLWHFESIPDGSTVSLANTTTISTSFTPDVAGFYVVCLIVNDGHVNSPCDTIVIKASSLSFSPIDVPGQTQIAGLDGVNNLGQVVGSFTDASGQHGFVMDNGRFRTIDYPGVTITSANAINDGGQIIGSAQTANNTF